MCIPYNVRNFIFIAVDAVAFSSVEGCMKKLAVGFLAALTVLAAGILAVSCNSAINEKIGTVVLDFGEGNRSLGSDALPLLSDSRILIEGEGGLSGSFRKEFSSAEGVSLSFPVGDEVGLKVSVLTPAARWSSAVQRFTVEPGTNAVSVKLKKNVSGLHNLLFTQTELYVGGTYKLHFDMDGKNFQTDNTSDRYSFVRDSKGQLCVRYNDGGVKLARYTSEGEPAGSPVSDSGIEFLANDYTTGKLYGFSAGALKKIKEDLSSTSPFSPSPPISGPFSVDNGIFTWGDIASSKIYLWKDGTVAAALPHGDFSHQALEYRLGHNDGFKVKDIFIRGGYVYLLLAAVRNDVPHGLYSIGAVLKWKIGTDASGTPRFEGAPVVIGKSAGNPAVENGVLKTYDYSKNFYGAVKVIGFDDENLYIADDGFDAAYVDDYPRIVKNRNRIAALNMKTNEIRFTEAGSAKWYDERKEWAGTKTIVWNYGGTSYYQVETGAENPLPIPFADNTKHLTDVFCYDAAGNLYVANNVSPSYKVYRFALKDDGSYGSDDKQAISVMPDAMAVSVSSIAADAGKTILFYYQKPSGSLSNHEIKRLAWPTDTFFSAATASAITLADLGENSTVTALAANKDGIFVAVKTVTGKDTANEKYMIRVKKYAHTPLSGGSASVSGIVTVVGETSANYDSSDRDKYINENLNALYIKDGILYGLITKQKGYALESSSGSHSKEVFIGGKLIKMGETASFDDYAGSSAVTLYENEGFTPETSGKFAPCRFIAIKPKKLVIASKGYYGKFIKDDGPYNPVTEQKIYKKVFVFDIGNWANPDETVTQAGFSKDLSYCNGFSWQ